MSGDQSAETYAVCQNCGTLSADLSKCESCSVPLLEDAVICYSAEPPPKRSRSSDQTTDNFNNNAQNGTSTPTSDPVPTQLFTSAAAGAKPQPVPQTLFVNQNGMVSNNNSVPPLTSAPVQSTKSVMTNVQNVLQTPVTASTALPSHTSSKTLNSVPSALVNHPPPPLASAPTQNFSSNAKTVNRPLSTGNSGTGPPSLSSNELPKESVIHFEAFQVRMGSQKFLPSVPVEVKPTGILMTLQGSVKAPVLINARAIVSCKINFEVYPIILVYLEGSCIRQLRNIFRLPSENFNAQGNRDIQRRITIFPNLKKSDVSIAQLKQMFKSMEKSETSQNTRLFVSEISDEDTIDVMLDNDYLNSIPKEQPNSQPIENHARVAGQAGSTNAANAANHLAPNLSAAQNMVPQSGMNQRIRAGNIPSVSTTMAAVPQTMNRFAAQQRMMTQAPQTLRNMQQNIPQQGMACIPGTVQQQTMAGRQQQTAYNGVRPQIQNVTRNSPQLTNQIIQNPTRTGDGATQIVQMPTNSNGWQHLKRTLKKGQLYQVATQDKQTKFAVWDGDKFLFYNGSAGQVKETKVELECSSIRIGTMVAAPVRPIAIDLFGIQISIRADRIYTLHIPVEDLGQSCVCVHRKCSNLLIDTTSSGSEKIRKALNMPSMPDSKTKYYYNSKSSAEKYKHIVVQLTNVSTEQKNALLAMKDPAKNQNLFKEIHFLAAVKIVEDIEKSLKEKVVENTGGQESDDDDCIMLDEVEVGTKCPYTQKVMKDPIRNKHCNHNYEKEAIFEFIANKKGNARCPYAGCGNRVPLRREDLEINLELKKIIEKEEAEKNS